MSKVIAIRKALKNLMIAKHPRVFYQVAGKTAIKPYVVFNLPNSVDDGSLENFVLEVDGWDETDTADSTVIETMMADVDSALHRAVVRTAGMALIIYRENRISVPDDDERILHRLYVYQVRTFGGG